MKKNFLAFLLIAIVLFSTRTVFAHASVMVCAPHIGANLAKPPAQIVCVFDGSLANSRVTMTVTDADGQRVDKNDARPFEGDAYSYVISLDTAKMKNGIYQLNWILVDEADGDEMSGTVQFGVNTIVPPTPTVYLPGQVMVTPSAQTTGASSATNELISRFMIGAGVIVLLAMVVLFWRVRSGQDDSAE